MAQEAVISYTDLNTILQRYIIGNGTEAERQALAAELAGVREKVAAAGAENEELSAELAQLTQAATQAEQVSTLSNLGLLQVESIACPKLSRYES